MSAALKPMKECPYYKGMGFYTSDSNFDPAAEWPGTTWQKLEGVFILATSSDHPVGESGGEETHTLSVDEMPKHNHGESMPTQGYSGWPSYKTDGYGVAINYSSGGNYFGPNNTIHFTTTSAFGATTGSIGSNQPHNNMPPYISRIYWERIA